MCSPLSGIGGWVFLTPWNWGGWISMMEYPWLIISSPQCSVSMTSSQKGKKCTRWPATGISHPETVGVSVREIDQGDRWLPSCLHCWGLPLEGPVGWQGHRCYLQGGYCNFPKRKTLSIGYSWASTDDRLSKHLLHCITTPVKTKNPMRFTWGDAAQISADINL